MSEPRTTVRLDVQSGTAARWRTTLERTHLSAEQLLGGALNALEAAGDDQAALAGLADDARSLRAERDQLREQLETTLAALEADNLDTSLDLHDHVIPQLWAATALPELILWAAEPVVPPLVEDALRVMHRTWLESRRRPRAAALLRHVQLAETLRPLLQTETGIGGVPFWQPLEELPTQLRAAIAANGQLRDRAPQRAREARSSGRGEAPAFRRELGEAVAMLRESPGHVIADPPPSAR